MSDVLVNYEICMRSQPLRYHVSIPLSVFSMVMLCWFFFNEKICLSICKSLQISSAEVSPLGILGTEGVQARTQDSDTIVTLFNCSHWHCCHCMQDILRHGVPTKPRISSMLSTIKARTSVLLETTDSTRMRNYSATKWWSAMFVVCVDRTLARLL